MKKKLVLFFILSITRVNFSQTIEMEVIRKINQLRVQNGGLSKNLGPLVRNSGLDSAAMYHARWIVASNCTQCHVETKSLPGIKALPEFWDRAAKYGVMADAENLIRYVSYEKVNGSIDPKQSANTAFLMWKASSGHLENMLLTFDKSQNSEIGIAVVPNGQEGFCIVMLIGSN
jgi:uncharacterized protein YkwD